MKYRYLVCMDYGNDPRGTNDRDLAYSESFSRGTFVIDLQEGIVIERGEVQGQIEEITRGPGK